MSLFAELLYAVPYRPQKKKNDDDDDQDSPQQDSSQQQEKQGSSSSRSGSSLAGPAGIAAGIATALFAAPQTMSLAMQALAVAAVPLLQVALGLPVEQDVAPAVAMTSAAAVVPVTAPRVVPVVVPPVVPVVVPTTSGPVDDYCISNGIYYTRTGTHYTCETLVPSAGSNIGKIAFFGPFDMSADITGNTVNSASTKAAPTMTTDFTPPLNNFAQRLNDRVLFFIDGNPGFTTISVGYMPTTVVGGKMLLALMSASITKTVTNHTIDTSLYYQTVAGTTVSTNNVPGTSVVMQCRDRNAFVTEGLTVNFGTHDLMFGSNVIVTPPIALNVTTTDTATVSTFSLAANLRDLGVSAGDEFGGIGFAFVTSYTSASGLVYDVVANTLSNGKVVTSVTHDRSILTVHAASDSYVFDPNAIGNSSTTFDYIDVKFRQMDYEALINLIAEVQKRANLATTNRLWPQVGSNILVTKGNYVLTRTGFSYS